QPTSSGDELRRLTALSLVWIAGDDGPRRHAVRSEDHRNASVVFAGDPLRRFSQSLGECGDQSGMIVPRLYEIQLERLLHHRAAVESHAGSGILWRQAQDRGVPDTVSPHQRYDVRNEWLPVAHAQVHAPLYGLLQRRRLPVGDFGKRRLADLRVAVLDFLD